MTASLSGLSVELQKAAKTRRELFTEVEEADTYAKGEVVICKICGKDVDTIYKEGVTGE